MTERVVHYNLYQHDSQLVYKGRHTDGRNPAHNFRLDKKMRLIKLHLPEPYHVDDNDKGGNNLSYYGSESGSRHTHTEAEDKEGVEACVYYCTHNITEHRHIRASVGSYKVAAACRKDKEREADSSYAYIFLGVGQYVGRGAEEVKKRRKENFRYCGDNYAAEHKKRKGVTYKIGSLFCVALSHGEVVAACSPYSEEEGKSDTGGGEGEGYIRSGISQCTDILSDKKLVNDVIERAYEHGDNTWYGEFRHKLSYRLGSERICFFFSHFNTSFSIHFYYYSSIIILCQILSYYKYRIYMNILYIVYILLCNIDIKACLW